MEMQVLRMDEKGRVMVPANFREKVKVREFVAIEKFGELVLVPKIPLEKLAGLAPELDLVGLRDKKDREIEI